MSKQMKQVSDERYRTLVSRYEKFQATMDDENLEPVRVFDPLSQRANDELVLIRDASKELQIKKNYDVSKAAQAEVEAKEIEAAAAPENTEEPALKEDS